ncbi:FadR/GntR family transcriptional regulator [Bailinhaonella thermotolerans]|uniref:FadR family transcriptional regulator n=1 Tax=Bailinhaonella thermotolerans TaxID=1070861 RepID=A0A3A4AW78_9ACTN|nr:FadR/GntR family transcriptional regulator [Bailinhaonella thermotolerans]RJL34490.1 FadR family transcriptional regulator [Bailinhaonella thermotolerans]
MALQSAQRSALVDQVIAQLRAEIAAGSWPVGSRIPTEPELSAMLGVGRNTVREGVRALAHAGLLEIRQGAGTFVRAASELAGAVRRRVADSEWREALEVRRALEVEAARGAASRRTEADMAGLEAALARREQAWSGGDVERFVEADVRLHELIVRAAHNRLLADLYADLGDAIRTTLRRSVGEGLCEDKYVDHSRLIAAIRARDAQGAVREASEYLSDMLDGLD